MVHIIRVLFVLVVLGITIPLAMQEPIAERGFWFMAVYVLVPALLAAAVVLADMFWRRKRLHVLSGLFVGVLAGLVFAFIISLVVDLVAMMYPSPPEVQPPVEMVEPVPAEYPRDGITYEQAMEDYRQQIQRQEDRLSAHRAYVRYTSTVSLVKWVLGAAAVFLCVTIVLQTKDDFRFVIPYVEFQRQSKGPRQLLLDTSVIVDGRIADIAETRIVESELVVPRFILAELQAIADSDDKLRRNRGRRGLDVLNRLQNSDKVDIRIIDPHVAAVEEAPAVDAKLVALAEHLNARVVTNDYNLNKIAQLRGVDVININDLANALKPVVLPGETLSVRIIRPGEEAGQGVGYLDDGTMIVAEQARDYVGKDVNIIVTSALQTSAGRMIFGRTEGAAGGGQPTTGNGRNARGRK
ncbi:MAG: PIN/TRAM domain-containing protein [Phycisphaerae bacterium]